MADKIDYKKVYKDLYQPKQKPMVVEVPAIPFIMVAGAGNPNDEDGEYKNAIEILYGLTFTIKMSKMSGNQPAGYFEYVVPPLEGLWWLDDDKLFDFVDLKDKDQFRWISMIRQPEFVTQDVFEWASQQLAKKKPELALSKAQLGVFNEGLCVQMLHIGLYDDEPETVAQIERYIEENNLQSAIGDKLESGMIRRHHEIYMGDPRKGDPQKRKTIIRHPVKLI